MTYACKCHFSKTHEIKWVSLKNCLVIMIPITMASSSGLLSLALAHLSICQEVLDKKKITFWKNGELDSEKFFMVI